MKILILHHVEEMWEEGLKSYNTNFEEVSRNIVNYIEHSDFDKVVLIRFMDSNYGDKHHYSGLSEHIDEIEIYGYGWKRDEAEEDHPDGEGMIWADGCSHSEVVFLEDFLKNLKGHEVTITGAFANECILTLTTALDHCEVDYEEEDSLIVGTGIEYDYILDIDNELEKIAEQHCHHDEIERNDRDDAKEFMESLIKEADCYDDFKEVDASGAFGVELYDSGLIDVDDIHIPSLYSHITANEDKVRHYQFNEIELTLEDGKFWVQNEKDANLIMVFKENNFNEVPVCINKILDDAIAFSGININNEEQFDKIKSYLEKDGFDAEPELALAS